MFGATAPAIVSAILLTCWPKLKDFRFRCPDDGDWVFCVLMEASLLLCVVGTAGCETGCSFALVSCGTDGKAGTAGSGWRLRLEVGGELQFQNTQVSVFK